MIGEAIQAIKRAAVELDESMGAIVGGWEAPGLTNNAFSMR